MGIETAMTICPIKCYSEYCTCWSYCLLDICRHNGHQLWVCIDTIHCVISWNGPPDISRGVSGRFADRRSAPATDSLWDVWWTVSRNYTVLSLSRDIKNIKFNRYLPVLLASLNVSESRFRKMFWMWRHLDMVLWRHGGGAWHNGLIWENALNVTSSWYGIVASRRWCLTQWSDPNDS